MSAAKAAYQALSRVFSIVLLLLGIFLLIAGLYAHNYVSNQLGQEKITMPSAASLSALPKESQDALKPFADSKMDSGDKAQAYANHYIWEHMQTACKSVKASDGTTATVPADQCTYAGIGDFTNKYKADLKAKGKSDADIAKDPMVTALTNARTSNFQGDALRSMLLTAYAFWLVGTIAIWAGILCLLGAILLGLLGWLFLKNRANHAEPAHTTTEPVRTTTQPVTTTTQPVHTTGYPQQNTTYNTNPGNGSTQAH